MHSQAVLFNKSMGVHQHDQFHYLGRTLSKDVQWILECCRKFLSEEILIIMICVTHLYNISY